VPEPPDLNRLLAPAPVSASSPAAPPGQPPASASSLTAPPGQPPASASSPARSAWLTKKEEERKKKKRNEKKYLFVENMISKLYCLLLFGKENKK
jgi:hypothetical protein